MTARETGAVELKPVDMVLFCPKCGLQHVDAQTPDWTNPPHRSHLCHECGCVWRPADVPTNGVALIQTCGVADTVFYNRAALTRPQPTPSATGEIVERLRKIAPRRLQGQAPPIGAFNMDGLCLWELNELVNQVLDLAEQQAATIAELPEAAEDAGREAYEQGYKDGFVDYHVREIGEWPDDDGASLLRGLDSTSKADGWQNHLDTFRATLERTGGQ